MGDFVRFLYVSNFSEPSSLLVRWKQTGFSTNTGSEAKVAVFKVKQLRLGLEDKVCIIQEGSRKHWSWNCVNPLTLLYKDNPQRYFPVSANIYYVRWIDVLNKVKLLMKFSVSFHMETMSNIIKADKQSINNCA